MTEKRFEIYDEENGYVKDNKTGESYSACGGGDGFPFIINEYHKLQEENKQLKMGIDSLKLLVQNWEALDDEKNEQLDRQNQTLKKLKKENEQLKQFIQSLAEQSVNGKVMLRDGKVYDLNKILKKGDVK